MTLKYIITKNIHKFFNYEDCDKFRLVVEEIKADFKYGNVIFDTGYDDHVYFLAMYNDRLVGILKFKVGGMDSCFNPGFCNWVCFIEVHKDYRNKGIGKELRKRLFKYCAENGLNVLSSGFTLLGHMYNLKGYIELAKKYGVEYSYKEGVDHPNFHTYEGIDKKEYMAYYEKHKSDFGCYENIVINKKGI